jgi:hypothetical protein
MDKACYERGCICYDAQDHSEYVEVVAKQEKCKYPNCGYPCMDLPDCQEQEQDKPQQRKPLTDEQISDIAINNPPMVHEFARAIEAAHGIKD